jgi:hypothetical protein
MEHETGSGWTGSPAQHSSEAEGEPAADAIAGAGEPEPEPAPAPEGPAPATGEPRVDAALRLLDRLPGLPVSDHPELFEQVHAQLSEVLGELDPGPADGTGQVSR